MSASALLWIAIASLLGACLMAIAARSLHSFSRHELEEICEKHNAQGRFAEILHCHESYALGVEMMVLMLVAVAMSAGSLWTWKTIGLAQSWSWTAFVVLVLVLGQVFAVATVWLPWSIARIAGARVLYSGWPLWRLIGITAKPLVWSAHAIDVLLHKSFGRTEQRADEESIEEEIRTIVTEGHREGLIEEDAREMIESVMELGDANVSRIMTPRTEIHMVQVGTAWEEVIETVIESGHTRVPVYDKTRDDIVGILYSKDLLPELAKGAGEPARPLAELLRKPLFVPETKPVDDLLKLFQKSRTHIAVVLDEFGGVSGLVTIEDVLEEIVGEIDDEYDQQSEEIVRKIDDDACEALGRAHIDEINELMGFELPEDANFDTIGGFVFAELGRVPAAGESMTWHDSLRVTVLEASRRRVNRVRLERIRKELAEAV